MTGRGTSGRVPQTIANGAELANRLIQLFRLGGQQATIDARLTVRREHERNLIERKASGTAERDQRQAEWNALHYELLQRVVSETAKVSLEVQSLALRIESLSAKVDFNERRVRGIEGTVHQAKPAGPRDRESLRW